MPRRPPARILASTLASALASCLALTLLSPTAPRAAEAATTLSSALATPPIIAAHRGWLAPDRPENSLQTMQATEAAGPFMLEMDLALTADGSIALLHDATIDRTMDGTGAVADLSDAALRAHRLRDPAGRLTTQRPPFLSDVLAWARQDPHALLMLDIKHTPPARVMPPVRQAGMTSRVLLLTFDPATSLAAFASDPHVLVSVLVRSDLELDAARTMANGRRFAAYIPRDRPSALFARAHALGAVVVTDLLSPHNALANEGDAHALLDRDPIDILVSNRPAATARAIGRAGF